MAIFDHSLTIVVQSGVHLNIVTLKKFTSFKKRTARVILNVSFDFSSQLMFEKLEWMNIFSRIKYFQAVLMFKCMNGLCPDYLSDKFTSCSNVYNYSLRSSTSGHLFVPRPNSEFFKKTFQYSGLIM